MALEWTGRRGQCNLHGIRPVTDYDTGRGYFSCNQHSIGIPVVPAGGEGERRTEIAIDVERNRCALDGEVGGHFCQTLHDNPDDGGNDDERFSLSAN